MRLPLAVLLSFSVVFGSGSPAPAPAPDPDPKQNRLTFFENLGHTRLKFNWRNLTCPSCKALFVILDIALLVLFTFLLRLTGFLLVTY